MMLVFLICGALVAFCDCNSDIVSDEFVTGNIKFTSRVYKVFHTVSRGLNVSYNAVTYRKLLKDKEISYLVPCRLK